ncbi:hypothetical protein STRDD11_00416 [Streptococcus sp. DD11]|nr:hypothetical protein STRDD11_00416 [Streptococcus sp. DD11]
MLTIDKEISIKRAGGCRLSFYAVSSKKTGPSVDEGADIMGV